MLNFSDSRKNNFAELYQVSLYLSFGYKTFSVEIFFEGVRLGAAFHQAHNFAVNFDEECAGGYC